MSIKNLQLYSGNGYRIKQQFSNLSSHSVKRSREPFVTLALAILMAFPIDTLAVRGRVKVADNTIKTDMNTLIRGARVSLDIWDETPSQADVTAMKTTRGLNAFHIYAEYAGSNKAAGYNSAKVDKVVDLAEKNDLYVVLTIGCGGANGSFNQNFVTTFWDFYGPRYKDKTFVVYEIMNEPQAWSAPYKANVLTMEKNAYDQVRKLAPDTHIMMMSYSQPVNPTQAANECANLGISWTNASVAFHTYGIDGKEDAALKAFYTAMKGKGIGYTCTEPNLTLKAITTKLFERDGVSETQFISVREIVNTKSSFYDMCNNNNITWVPDFGTWPQNAVGVFSIKNNSNVTADYNLYPARTFNCLGNPISEKSNISSGLYINKSREKIQSTVNLEKSR